jgi:hypothetical protein
MIIRTKFRYSGMRLFSYIFPIFLLMLYLPGILIDLDTLNLYQALIMLPGCKTFAEEVGASRSSIGCLQLENAS